MTIPPLEHAIFGTVITLPELNPPDPDWLLSQLDSDVFRAGLDYYGYLCHALGGYDLYGRSDRTRFITDALQEETLANYVAKAIVGWDEVWAVFSDRHCAHFGMVEKALMPMRHAWCDHMLKHLKEQQ